MTLSRDLRPYCVFGLSLLIFTCGSFSGAVASDLYVSPSGSDENPGSLDKPLATFQAARDLLRERRTDEPEGAGPATVWIGDGTYRLRRTFELGAEDSAGRAPEAIVYRAAEGARPRLIGGVPIATDRLEPVSSGSILERLVPEARPHVRVVDLAALGVEPFGEPPASYRDGGGMPELYLGDRPLQLARWPNEGYVTFEAVVERGDIGRDPKGKGGAFVYQGDQPSRWNADDGVWLFGYWCHDWYCETIRIASIDPEKRVIRLAAPHAYGIGRHPPRYRPVPRRYFALNLLDELDAPGEWYIDREENTLYLWPPDDIGQDELVLTELAEPMIRLDGASHIRLIGLTLEYGRGDGIEIDGGSDNEVRDCTIRNLAGQAVWLREGHGNGVRGCQIAQIGRGGVDVRGGDLKQLEPAGHYVIDCHIHDVGRLQKTHAPAVWLRGVGHRVANNLMHDMPHTAIFYGGNEHVIELNEIHHVAMETGDVGAIYTGRDWTSRGNLLRWNYLHHMGGDGVGGTMGIYLDDCDSGDSLVGNIFYRAGRYAAFVGGGRDNLIDNNVMIECYAAVHFDARGTRGYIKFDEQGTPSLLPKCRAVGYQNPPWSTRYPKLARIMDEEPILPLGNVVRNNVSVRCEKWLNLGMNVDRRPAEIDYTYDAARRYVNLDPSAPPSIERVEFENNLVLGEDEDAGFVDPDQGNFQLRDDSIVYKKIPGFERIPFERIGLMRE